jgi:hypothetical protein
VNSTEALDFALRLIDQHCTQIERRRATYSPRSTQSLTNAAHRLETAESAYATLKALREVILDNDRRLAEQREEERA